MFLTECFYINGQCNFSHSCSIRLQCGTNVSRSLCSVQVLIPCWSLWYLNAFSPALSNVTTTVSCGLVSPSSCKDRALYAVECFCQIGALKCACCSVRRQLQLGLGCKQEGGGEVQDGPQLCELIPVLDQPCCTEDLFPSGRKFCCTRGIELFATVGQPSQIINWAHWSQATEHLEEDGDLDCGIVFYGKSVWRTEAGLDEIALAHDAEV